jgi:hypothetical protein
MITFKELAVAAAIVAMASSSAMATPSTQIWIPSTDVKGFKEINISIDNYARLSSTPDSTTGVGVNTYDVGLTFGILPLENFKIEVGVDYMTDNVSGSAMEKHPANLNFKGGIPEDAFFKGMPAIAAGMFAINTASDPLSANVAYGLIAKTFPVIGRLTVGGYNGAERSLGVKSNTGVLASWDRTMSEISDKLWLAVDYQSGNNFMGAVSFGGSWAFSKQVSLIVGANIYNPGQETLYGGKPTFTTQLDINLP